MPVLEAVDLWFAPITQECGYAQVIANYAYLVMKICSTLPLLLAIAALILPVKPALADTPSAPTTADFAQALAGTNFPLSLKLKDLTPEWRRLSVGGQSDLASMIPFIGTLLEALGDHTYYTQGKTVSLGSETFLVVYRLPGNGISLNSLQNSSAKAEKTSSEVTSETVLALSLLNLRSVNNLAAIQVFNLEQELANYQIRREVLQQRDGGSSESACPPASSNEGEAITPSTI
jgi:hypothetical protein